MIIRLSSYNAGLLIGFVADKDSSLRRNNDLPCRAVPEGRFKLHMSPPRSASISYKPDLIKKLS